MHTPATPAPAAACWHALKTAFAWECLCSASVQRLTDVYMRVSPGGSAPDNDQHRLQAGAQQRPGVAQPAQQLHRQLALAEHVGEQDGQPHLGSDQGASEMCSH